MNIKSIKNYAKFAAVIMSILIGIHLLNSIADYIDMVFEPAYILSYVASFVLTVIALIACINGILLLRGIVKDESPFTKKTVKRLKLISAMLLIFEPVMYLFNHITNQFNPEFVTNVSLGWVVLTSGAVMACVTLVFEYGVELQNQVDETL